jgi:hypothetical protein
MPTTTAPYLQVVWHVDVQQILTNGAEVIGEGISRAAAVLPHDEGDVLPWQLPTGESEERSSGCLPASNVVQW